DLPIITLLDAAAARAEHPVPSVPSGAAAVPAPPAAGAPARSAAGHSKDRASKAPAPAAIAAAAAATASAGTNVTPPAAGTHGDAAAAAHGQAAAEWTPDARQLRQAVSVARLLEDGAAGVAISELALSGGAVAERPEG